MTLSSKTWTQVKMIVKTCQPQVWNQVLNCGIFLQLHVPKSWQWLHYSRLGFPSLESFWSKEFQHQTLAKNYAFHDLAFQDVNTSEHDCQDLAATTVLKSYIFLETWQYPMSWNVTFFGNSMPPSLDNDCTRYSRLGFPSLETFWGKEFQHLTLAKNYVFHDLVFQDVTTSEHDCQDLAATGLKSYIFLCYNFATPCPQVLTKIALFKTWLSKSWNFLLYRLSAV